MRIFAHCASGYAYFVKALIEESLRQGLAIEWGVILYTNSDLLLDDFRALVGADNVLYLQEQLNDAMSNPEFDLACLRDFPASVFECIAASKDHKGHNSLYRKRQDYQLKLFVNTHNIYKKFIGNKRPDFVFFPLLEQYDSMILYHLSLAEGIHPIVYVHSRNLGVSYFSDSMFETMPDYPLPFTEEDRKNATAFVNAFRRSFRKVNWGGIVDNSEVLEDSYLKNTTVTKRLQKYVLTKAKQFGFPLRSKAVVYEPHLMDTYTLVHKVKVLCLPFIAFVRKQKQGYRRIAYDVDSLDRLPAKFVYYPLQYSPEVSINVPAPYFVDQLRAIDLILLSLPVDFFLVIKEHPAMMGLRPGSFYENLKKRANILLADMALPSIELTIRAGLTISVTGTACLEAFILGKPSIHLGRAFFTEEIRFCDNIRDMKQAIREAIANGQVPFAQVVDFVSRVFSIGDDFIVANPKDPYLDSRLIMKSGNIQRCLTNMLTHCHKVIAEKA